MWGQRDPQGDFNELMTRVKGNLEWWNKQLLLELGVDQAALIGEPDPLVYGLGMIFTTFVDRIKAWFEQEIVQTNERIRWINNKLPGRLELNYYFHAFESEENRSEMIGWVMSTFHLLHI